MKKHKKLEKHRNQQGLDELLFEETNLKEEREKNKLLREEAQGKISAIDQSIYELSCIPEFSNVWLIGKDRNRTLYWVLMTAQSSFGSTKTLFIRKTLRLVSGTNYRQKILTDSSLNST